MTQGRDALLAVLTRTRRAFVASRCRVSVSTVDKWASGARKPSTAVRDLLAVTYGIPSKSWDKRKVSTVHRPATNRNGLR